MYAGLASFACSLVSPSTPADKGWGHLCFAEMYLYCIRICTFSLHLCLYMYLYLEIVIPKLSDWRELWTSLFWKDLCLFWQILRLRNGWQVFRGNDGFSVIVNVNIRMSSSLALDKRVSDVGLYTFPGEHRPTCSNTLPTRTRDLSHGWDSELRDWHSRN